MLMMSVMGSLVSILTGTYSSLEALIAAHSYLAIIALMAVESASVPIPSEVVLPLVGNFIRTGVLNPYLGVLATMVGTAIGISVDYAMAYAFGKEVLYKHLNLFHVSRKSIDAFDNWFAKNGDFAVFVSRLLPLVRGLISFPAGLAKMPLKRFYLYSLAGSLIWNVALIAFGYYAFSISNGTEFILAIAGFAIILYLVYHLAMKRIRRA